MSEGIQYPNDYSKLGEELSRELRPARLPRTTFEGLRADIDIRAKELGLDVHDLQPSKTPTFSLAIGHVLANTVQNDIKTFRSKNPDKSLPRIRIPGSLATSVRRVDSVMSRDLESQDHTRSSRARDYKTKMTDIAMTNTCRFPEVEHAIRVQQGYEEEDNQLAVASSVLLIVSYGDRILNNEKARISRPDINQFYRHRPRR